MKSGVAASTMGMTIKEVVFDVGGGIKQGKEFKAVQMGGPSGGCIPEDRLDLQVGFDELRFGTLGLPLAFGERAIGVAQVLDRLRRSQPCF